MPAVTRLGVSGFPRPVQAFFPKSFVRGRWFVWNAELQAWMMPVPGAVVSAAQPPQFDGRLWYDTAATGSPGATLVTTTTITSDTTLTTSHGDVFCDASSGPITVTLPAAAANAGRAYLIKKIDVSANVVTIDGNGSDIDGDPTRPLSSQYAGLVLRAHDGQWWIR